jgi:hypothetical protein
MAAFVTVLLCSNIIGPGKVCQIWGFSFGAGNLFFPISYIFGDIMTEVYGYARARKVIWAGFGAMIFATFMSQVVLRMPADPAVAYNAVIDPALHTVFGNTWRIVAGSIVAFWAGDFLNSYVLARMKVWTGGRMLWARTIGSTMAGQAVDSLIFYPIAFWGIWDPSTMVSVVAFNYALKVTWEAINTPFTYAIVGALKKAEGVDWFDRDTDFTPFSLKD